MPPRLPLLNTLKRKGNSMPPRVLGNQASSADDTTMIIYRNRRPISSERKRELARRCGINCIRLKYKESLKTYVSVSGFQPVRLMVVQGLKGLKTPTVRWLKNEITNEPLCEGTMDFVPDELGTGYAYLPDSSKNRITLACAEMEKNATWEIDDEKVKAEIDKLASEIAVSIEHRKAVEELEYRKTEVEEKRKLDNISLGIESKSPLEIQNAVLKDKIKELELKKEQKELRKRLVALQGDHPEAFRDDNTVIKTAKEKEALREKRQAARMRAKADIYLSHQELIDEIKAKHEERTGKTKGWGFSQEYITQIEPLIKKRTEEILLEDEHTTTGDVDQE